MAGAEDASNDCCDTALDGGDLGMPTANEFRAGLKKIFEEARTAGNPWVEVLSKDLHVMLGGYPGLGHQMPVCCGVMRQEYRDGDEILRTPPSGAGATLLIRYALPRNGLETADPGDFNLEGFPAGVQHEAARQALPIIAKAARTGAKLTYQGLALAIGRPIKHARAVAQVCDLLDSASTLSHRPLMALWTVRSANGEINPDAWVKDALPELRDLLIAEAEAHEFSEADEYAMRGALDDLLGMGNRKAWEHVRTCIPQAVMVARLKGEEPPPGLDSLNDLGNDQAPVIATVGRRYVRDQAVRDAVIRRAKGLCEFCHQPGFMKPDGTRYLECHHIIALAAQGEDRMTNVIALCPGHHREAHFGRDAAAMEAEMVRIVEKQGSRA
jgi:hypothetical protein